MAKSVNNFLTIHFCKEQTVYILKGQMSQNPKNVQDILIKQSNVVQLSGTSLQKLTKCDKKMDLSSEMIPENKEKVQE